MFAHGIGNTDVLARTTADTRPETRRTSIAPDVRRDYARQLVDYMAGLAIGADGGTDEYFSETCSPMESEAPTL